MLGWLKSRIKAGAATSPQASDDSAENPNALPPLPSLPAAPADPAPAKALLQKAMQALNAKRLDDAVDLLQQALEANPRLAAAHLALADLLRARDGLDFSLEHYRYATELDPGNAVALSQLGSVLRDLGHADPAADFLERACQQPSAPSAAVFNLGLLRAEQKRWDEACELLQRYARMAPKDPDGHYWLGNARMALGRATEARKAYETTLRLDSQYLPARWCHTMAQLPAVAQAAREQDDAVHAFRNDLVRMATWFRANPQVDGSRAVGSQQPFYLAYIGGNHRDLLADYGALCDTLMSGWQRRTGLEVPTGDAPAKPIAGRKRAKRRIGIVSAHLHSHSVWHAVVRGWVEHLDPAAFDLHLFHVGTQIDAETRWAAKRSAHFLQGVGPWEEWARHIASAGLDVLIYPEIGMDSTTTRLAALRLAPRQLASWGHPMSTGLPSIDGYLSAEAFEPEGADAHYTERLIRLPALGCCYRPFELKPSPIDRGALGIAAQDRLLLCAGTAFKYAPQDDALWIDIARRCAPCKLVFFKSRPDALSALLEARLRRTFGTAGLSFDDHVRFIPWQSHDSFFGLLKDADMLLDTVGFSGFNTAMQAIECGTPVVAWQGDFMRGRFAAAVLEQLGLGEWVASDHAGYVERVARLCSDAEARPDMVRTIESRRDALMNNRSAVDALAQVLAQ
jgi:predicted O-linked N-acetylglucosamine transferase (SPINDLY family)